MLITAVCCFTPILAIGLGALGLSAWLAWLDFVLLPMLLGFAGVTAIGWWLKKSARRNAATTEDRS